MRTVSFLDYFLKNFYIVVTSIYELEALFVNIVSPCISLHSVMFSYNNMIFSTTTYPKKQTEHRRKSSALFADLITIGGKHSGKNASLYNNEIYKRCITENMKTLHNKFLLPEYRSKVVSFNTENISQQFFLPFF